MGLKPKELYEIDLVCFGEMVQALTRKEEEDFDVQMQMLAWQTSLLMNSTGNFKKKIKPSDLYESLVDAKKKEKEIEEFNPDKKKQLQEELLSAFSGSNVVIK